MKIETAVKLNEMQAARDAILVRMVSKKMPVLRMGKMIQGKILNLSSQKAIIQLPSGYITVEIPSGIKLKGQVWLRLIRQHPVPQVELFRKQPRVPTMRLSNSPAITKPPNSEQMTGTRLPSTERQTWQGMIRRVIAGRQFLQPESIYHGQIMESTQGKTVILLDSGEILKLDGTPSLTAGKKVILRLTGKAEAMPAFIELMDSEEKSTASQPLLKQGQRLIAHMVQKLPSGKVLIELQGQQFEANAPRGISAGGHMLLRVTGVKPKPEFEILDSVPNVTAKALQLLRNLLLNRAPIGTDMMKLHQTLNVVMSSKTGAIEGYLDSDFNLLSSWLRSVLDGSKPPDPGLVKKMIMDGGQNYEPKLISSTFGGQVTTLPNLARQDLKAMLMQLLGRLKHAPDNVEIKKLTSLLGQTLTGIESAQASSLLTQLHGNGLRFEIPFVLLQQPATVYLSIKPDQHNRHAGSNRNHGYGVLFLLDLETTGQIRIDARLQAKTFRSTIYLEQPETLNFFKAAESSLRDRLEAMGFDMILLDFKTMSRLNPEKRQAFEELATGVPRNVNLLDTRG